MDFDPALLDELARVFARAAVDRLLAAETTKADASSPASALNSTSLTTLTTTRLESHVNDTHSGSSAQIA